MSAAEPALPSPSFEDALAVALERCRRGETPDAAAAAFPDHDLLPCLELAERLRAPASPSWLRRSLARLLRRIGPGWPEQRPTSVDGIVRLHRAR
jgi:hypothetical protein